MNHPDTLVLDGDKPTNSGMTLDYVIAQLELQDQHEFADVVKRAATLNATSTPPTLGQLWPEQGGIYIGRLLGDDGIEYHHVIATEGELIGVQWGSYGTAIAGAESDREGLANTDAMAAAGCQIATDVRALRIAGFDDWHIPARHQARLAYLNAGTHFDQDDFYWTSTQYSASSAWSQTFANGNQLAWSKVNNNRARAVRRFSVIQ